MKDRSKLIATVLAVICLTGTCVIWAVAEDTGKKVTVTCSISEMGVQGGCWLDLTDDQIGRLDVSYGTDLHIDFGERTFRAVYCRNYAGVPTFSMFLTYVSSSDRYGLGVYNADLSDCVSFSVGDTVKISVAGPNMYYSSIPDYVKGESKDRSDYPSDQAFANYRALNGGFLAEDVFYRSCTPWYGGERGSIADGYYESVGADWLICLDTDEDPLEKTVEQTPDLYSSELFLQGKVHAKMLSTSFLSHPEETRWFMDALIDTDGKVGIFCTYGKDRTGFYCLIIQALAGVSFEDAEAEFMLSMQNYYGIEKDSAEYDTVYEIYLFRLLYLIQNPDMIDDLIDVDWEHAELEDFVLEELITGYLLNTVGVAQDKIDALKARIVA